MILFMFFNNFFWAVDINIFIPNVIGSIFAPVVLLLIIYFSSKYSRKEEDEIDDLLL
jgi:hypothetical protein